MATVRPGARTSVYLAAPLKEKVSSAMAAGFNLSQIVDVGASVLLEGRVPEGAGVSGGPSAGVVRERVWLRGEGLRVVAPEARLPVDRNGGTPLAVFQPPPDAYRPPVADDDDE
jgi:hypothetical protein